MAWCISSFQHWVSVHCLDALQFIFFPHCKCIWFSQQRQSLFLLLLSLYWPLECHDQQEKVKVLFWEFWTQAIGELIKFSSFSLGCFFLKSTYHAVRKPEQPHEHAYTEISTELPDQQLQQSSQPRASFNWGRTLQTLYEFQGRSQHHPK